MRQAIDKIIKVLPMLKGSPFLFRIIDKMIEDQRFINAINEVEDNVSPYDLRHDLIGLLDKADKYFIPRVLNYTNVKF